MPYQGPLTNETEWYYADGFVQDSESHPLIQTEWISILNPNHEKTDITVIIYTSSGTVEYQTNVAAQSVKLIKLEELEIVPTSQRYGVGVKSTFPIVVQQTRRSLVKGGTPSGKSRKPLASVRLPNIFATMAVPLAKC